MKASIVINFNGDGQDAIRMYTEVFGLDKPNIVTYGSLPPNPGFVLSKEEEGLCFTVVNQHR